MAENEVDEITREMRKLGTTAVAAIAAWQARNPGKTKVPRRVKRDARRDLRNAMRAHELHLAEQRTHTRRMVEGFVHDHRDRSVQMHVSVPATPEEYMRVQWAHAQQRSTLERQILASPHLTREERGHAVMALTSAHYADNPNVKKRPVWGPKPYGMTALKARLAERLSRTREGLEQRLDRSVRTAPQLPATPSRPGLNPYWSDPATQQDQGANARLAAIERQLADLADFHDREQDRWQGKVNGLGERLLESRQEYRTVAEQLAQRGRELAEAHAEIERVRAERDALARQAHQARPAVTTPSTPQAPAAASNGAGSAHITGQSQAKAANGNGNHATVPKQPTATSTPPRITTIEEAVEGLSELIRQDPNNAAHVMREVPELAGMVADRLHAPQAKPASHGTHRVINGDVRMSNPPEGPGVIGMVINDRPGTPHGPVLGMVIDHAGKATVPDLPEPPDEFEPPEMEM